LSQSRASPAQIKARKNLDTTVTAATALDPADRCEGRIHGRLRSTTGDGNASNLRKQMVKDTLSRMATASSAARKNHTKRERSAGATEQLSGSIHEIGQQASHSLSMARSAVGDAERTNQTIRSLAEAAERASDRNK
jgi:glycosyltransferase A (GT-A) superfamily protein (DUF2064 family)